MKVAGASRLRAGGDRPRAAVRLPCAPAQIVTQQTPREERMAHRIRLRLFVVSTVIALAFRATGEPAFAADAGRATPSAQLFGFTAEESSGQIALEQRFDAWLNPE